MGWKSILQLILLPAVLGSCIKNKVDPLLADPGISVGIFDRFYYGEVKPVALNGSPAVEAIPDFVTVRYSSPKTITGPLHVTMQLDAGLVNAYNYANGANLVILPDSAYSLPNGLQFDMPGGSYAEIGFPVSFNKNVFNLQNVYALGIKIAAVSTGAISRVEGSVVVSIRVKNQFEGLYHSVGYLYHPVAPRNMELDKYLTTTGNYSLKCDLGDLGGAGYKAIFTLDPVNNNVTAVQAPGASGGPYSMWSNGLPGSYTPAWPGSALCNNTYNPSTRIFYMRYGYTGGTGYVVAEEHIRQY